MPRIPDQLLACVVYLYPSGEAAASAAGFGGTGFLVTVDDIRGPFHYVVTNRHVASGCRFVRLSRQGGESHVHEIPAGAWIDHEDGDDISAVAIELRPEWAVTPILWADFFGDRTRFADRLVEMNVGVGDDVVMTGRFVNHEGRERLAPLARFGNISLMADPKERVLDARGLRVEAFLVEMRSLAGFSGSPVFLHIGPGSDRADGRMTPFYSLSVALLGIDTGHLQVHGQVVKKGTRTAIDPEWEVPQNSGVAVVAPVWKIDQLLGQEEFRDQRAGAAG